MQTQEQLKISLENPFFKRYTELGIKESLFSDSTGALGHLQRQISKSAYPNLISRKIIQTRPTKETYERFPLDNKAVAYKYAEGTATRLSGQKNQVVEVTADILAEASDQWTKEYLEDASWNIIKNIVDKLGRALAVAETNHVLSLYGGMADYDLAGGGSIDQQNNIMDWKAVMRLHDAVRSENWKPRVLVLSETQVSQLLLDNKFIEYNALSSKETDIESGIIRRIVGMDVQSSTLVPNGTAYAIDSLAAGIMLIRRDVMVEDWTESKSNQYGIRATTRFGLGILRSSGVAKIVNIKTNI